MTTPHTHHEHESSHTDEAFDHNPVKQYLTIWGMLMGLLVITVLAASIKIHEPWSFLIALIIAVIKATLVILFFMHVKDASRVTWVFCGCSFIWLIIMLALTFTDYMTRDPAKGAMQAEMNPPPVLTQGGGKSAH